MSEISPSKLGEQFDAEFQTKLDACENPEQIKELMHKQELSRGLIKLDWDESFRIPIETPEPRTFARTVVIAGQKHVLEGASELEVTQKETELFRRVFAEPAARTEPREQPRNERVEDAAARAELELKFKKGDISASDYLQQSGAISDYLATQGVPLEELKAQVAAKQNEDFQRSYKDATTKFIARHPEWQGGDKNRETLGRIIIEQNLDHSDPLRALEHAYDYARKNNMLVENPDVAYHHEMQAARSHEDIARVNHKYFGTGLFNR
jgi:hypothetical protein